MLRIITILFIHLFMFNSFAAHREELPQSTKRTREQFSDAGVIIEASTVSERPIETKRTFVSLKKVITVAPKAESKPVECLSKRKFIYDAYTSRRGEPKMLEISCRRCNDYVMDYQKDGPGRLLRCYLDRIHAPSRLKERQYERFDVRTSPLLKCAYCKSTIGIPMIYASEDRPAYRMLQDSFYF